MDDRWTYFVSGFRDERELICVMGGNPITADYVADLFRKDGLTRVKWEDAKETFSELETSSD